MPVSIAAMFPDVKVTLFPLTVIAIVWQVVERSKVNEGIFIRTRDVKEPVSRLSDVSDKRKKLDIAGIQCLILTAKGENTTKCFLWGTGII